MRKSICLLVVLFVFSIAANARLHNVVDFGNSAAIAVDMLDVQDSVAMQSMLVLPDSAALQTLQALPDSCKLKIVQKYIAKADSCMEYNNSLAALKLYEQAYALHSIPTMLKKVIDCHYKRGDFGKCIELHDSICKDSINVLDLRLKYYCFSNLSQKDSALAYGLMVNELNPQDFNVVAKLAHYYNELQQPGNAMKIVEKFCREDSTNVYVNRQKAYSYYLMEDYDLALNEYKKLMAMGDSTDMLYYHAAICYENLTSLYDAYDHIVIAAETNGFKNPYIVAKLGLITRDIGAHAQAIEFLEMSKALLYPSDDIMFTITDAMAECCSRAKNYEDAIRYLKECLEYKGSPFIYYRIAQQYYHLKDLHNEKKYYLLFLDKIKSVSDLTDDLIHLKKHAEESIKTIDEELFFQEG